MAARILKAQSVHNASVHPTFNFVDLNREANDVITRAQQAAAEHLSHAKAEAVTLLERTRSDAREQGIREARDEMQRQANEMSVQLMKERLRTALPALKSAAEALQAERDRWLIRWEQTAVRVGVAIAGKLLKTQIAARPELATGMIAEALRLAAGQPRIVLHLNPDDLAAWGDQGPRIVESLTSCADSILTPDPQIARGGCRIETIHGEIDARVETMLERLANELIDG